jgi:purine-binding chemotaxis protein CheW
MGRNSAKFPIPVAAAAAPAPAPSPVPAAAGVFEFADQLAADAATVQAPKPVSTLHLITFRLDGEEFGLPVETVREVIRVGDITRVPQSPPHIRGVTNLRGRILPVVEIRTRLGLAPLVPRSTARIIVAEVRGRVLGLLVDSVAQVQKVPADRVVATPDEVKAGHSDYLTGVVQLYDRLLILLDLPRALEAAGDSHS